MFKPVSRTQQHNGAHVYEGYEEGDSVGAMDGDIVGLLVGTNVGCVDGATVGLLVGASVGK